jgi:hypothetical protein
MRWGKILQQNTEQNLTPAQAFAFSCTGAPQMINWMGGNVQR